MQEYLLKYLVLHKNLAIPKVGVFNIESLSAQIDGTNNLLYPPSQVIRFKQELVSPERNFYDFLVRETGLELVDVIKKLQQLSIQILADAKESKGAILEGIGTLKQENASHLLFFSDRPLEYLYPQVKIDKAISNSNDSHLLTLLAEPKLNRLSQSDLELAVKLIEEITIESISNSL